VPTPISHAAVGFAIGAWAQRAPPSTRVCVAAAACAALPDIDVLWSPLQLADSSPFAHRAITHSLLFALVAAVVVTAALFRRERRTFFVLLLALLSHSCLDALSNYSLGVAFFEPFSAERYRFPWTPLGRPYGEVASQLILESLVLLAPAVLLAWLRLRTRNAER